MSVISNDNWLTDDLKEEVVNLFQPLYDYTLTETEVINISNTLANLAELSIKFNCRIGNP